MHLLNINPFLDIVETMKICKYKKWKERCIHLWYTKKGPIMPLLGCSSLNIQVTRFNWEFDGPNLNVIFLSIQSPTWHSFKRIPLSIYFSFFILILMLDSFLVMLWSNTKRIKSLWIFRRKGVGKDYGKGKWRGAESFNVGKFCQFSFINFLGLIFPVICKTCLFIWRRIFLQRMPFMFFPGIQWYCLKIFSLIIKRASTSLMNRMRIQMRWWFFANAPRFLCNYSLLLKAHFVLKCYERASVSPTPASQPASDTPHPFWERRVNIGSLSS